MSPNPSHGSISLSGWTNLLQTLDGAKRDQPVTLDGQNLGINAIVAVARFASFT